MPGTTSNRLRQPSILGPAVATAELSVDAAPAEELPEHQRPYPHGCPVFPSLAK